MVAVAGARHPVRIQAPACIRVVLNEDRDAWYLHLIRIQQQTGSMFLDGSGRAEVVCTCTPPWEIERVRDAVTGDSIEWEQLAEGVCFTVGDVVDHRIVRIERSEA